MPSWASTVPSAEPAMPRPAPCTSATLSTTLAAAPAAATTSGVRVSCSPRRMPVAARTTSMAGSPGSDQRRYVTAWSDTSPEAPKAATSGTASTAPARAVPTPSRAASHTPSIPCDTAARRSPAPTRRATAAVVP
jgi:hypothetical protein